MWTHVLLFAVAAVSVSVPVHGLGWTLIPFDNSLVPRSGHVFGTRMNDTGAWIVHGGHSTVTTTEISISVTRGQTWSHLGSVPVTSHTEHQVTWFRSAWIRTGGYMSTPDAVDATIHSAPDWAGPWTLVAQASNSSIPARGGHKTVVWNATMLVMLGGYYYSSSTGWTDSQTIATSTNASSWSIVAPLSIWSSRNNFGAVLSLDNRTLYVAGGRTLAGVNGMSDLWSTTDLVTWTLITGAAPFGARSGHGMVTTPFGRFVAGGLLSSGVHVNDLWVSTTVETEWALVASTAPWYPRQEFGFLYVPVNTSVSYLVVSGGTQGSTDDNHVYQYTIDTSCVSQPCRHNGTCVPTMGSDGAFSCECAPGYNGTVCQTQLDECASLPCQNGGTCVDDIDGYTCQCEAGITGSTCQLTIVSVAGCATDTPTSTSDCDTTGGTILTIVGTQWPGATSITINLFQVVTQTAVACANVTRIDSQHLECVTPSQVGLDWIVQVTSGSFVLQQSTVTVSYAAPRVLALAGCATPQPTVSIVGCSRTQPSIVTLIGANFGPRTGLTILIGSQLCTSVVWIDDTHVTCLAASDTGAGRPIVMVQGGGGRLTVVTNSTVSFAQCAPGTYDDSGLCRVCGPGQTSTLPGSVACTSCLPGTMQPLSGRSQCTACPAGSAQPYSGSANCTVCGPGTYSAQIASQTCVSCSGGYYNDQFGQSTCQVCPIGTVSEQVVGSSQCLDCMGNQYSTQVASIHCDSCAGSQYYSSGSHSCQSCVGATCDSTGIVPYTNQYVYVDTDGNMHALPCASGSCVVCPTALSVTNTTSVVSCCGTNRLPANVNPLCGTCQESYYEWNGECVSCDKGTQGGYIFLFLVLLWIYMIVFYRLAQFSSADTRLLINFAQYIVLFWTSQAGSVSSWLSLFNFNIVDMFNGGTSSHPTCIGPWSDTAHLMVGVVVPMVTLGILMVNGMIHYGVWVKSWSTPSCASVCTTVMGDTCCPVSTPVSTSAVVGPRASDAALVPTRYILWRSYQRTVLAWAVTSYSLVTQTVWTFFNCIRVQNDTVVQDYPGLSCTSATYDQFKGLFIVLAIVVVAIPILIFGVLSGFYRTGRLYADGPVHGAIKVVFGTIYETYRPAHYYWEAVVLLRRLIVIVVAFAPSLATDSVLKFTCLTLVNVLFLGLHAWIRPYRVPTDNDTELLLQLMLVILTLWLVTVSPTSPPSTAMVAGLTAAILLVLVYLVARIVTHRYTVLRQKWNQRPALATAPATMKTTTTTSPTTPIDPTSIELVVSSNSSST